MTDHSHEVATAIIMRKLKELTYRANSGKRKPLKIHDWYERTVEHLCRHGYVSLYTSDRGRGYTTFQAALAVEAIRPSGSFHIVGGTCLHVSPTDAHRRTFLDCVTMILDEHDNVEKISDTELRHKLSGYRIRTVLPENRAFGDFKSIKPDMILTDEMARHGRYANRELHERIQDTMRTLRWMQDKITDEWNTCHMVECN